LAGRVGTEVGHLLSMGSSAVSRVVNRGELILQEKPILKETLEGTLRKG